MPLLVDGQVIGVLHVGTLTPREFTDDDAELLQLAADRAATSIERARLFHQRGVVEALQQSLVPERLPIVPGLGWRRATARRSAWRHRRRLVRRVHRSAAAASRSWPAT